MGLQVKVTAAVVPSLFRKIQPDSILPDAGALILIDPTHPLESWADGYVPAHSGVIPNVASVQAMSLTGGTAAEVKPTAFNTGTVDGTTIIRSRTSKGAIRAKGTYFGLRPSAKTVDYLIANATHNFYVSLYTRMNEVITSQQLFSIRDNTPTTSKHIAVMNSDGSVIPSSDNSRLLGSYKGGVNGNTIGMMHTALGYTGLPFYAGQTSGSLISGNQLSLFGPYASSGGTDRTTYGFYMEDLTVSGRTFAQVLAADKARYDKLFATGGRYNGDA